MFGFFMNKKASLNTRLEVLHQNLTALSIQSSGPTLLYNGAHNHKEILNVITLVREFDALNYDFDAKKIDKKDMEELRNVDFFNHDDPLSMNARITICLNSFPAVARGEASIYLRAIESLYKEAVEELSQKLRQYSPAY